MKILNKIKEHSTCEEAFKLFDQANIGYLTISGIQTALGKIFKVNLTQGQFLVLIKYMNPSNNGVITLDEFHKFYYETENTLKEQSKGLLGIGLEEIFKSLLDVLKERELTLLEIFSQIDNGNGYITIEDFVSMLRTIGHIISEERLVKLLKEDDQSFDNKISYNLLNRHIRNVAEKYGISKQLEGWDDDKLFYWRDKAIESILKSLNLITKDYEAYFSKFVSAHHGSLTPKEFREAMKSLKAVSGEEIERLLTLLSTNNNSSINIKHLVSYLVNYMNTPVHVRQAILSGESLIDEELFVTIFQQFDGLNVLNNKSYALKESATYLINHQDELNSRGCSLISNYIMLKRILNSSKNIVLNLKDIFVEVANSVLELVRVNFRKDIIEEAKKNLSSSKSNVDDRRNYDIPFIDPRKLILDRSSTWTLPSGCICCRGIYEEGKIPIRVQMYDTKVLGRVSGDGKTYKKHLEVELAAQMLLHSKYPDLTFKVIGKYEKRTGIGEDSIEQHIIFEDIPDEEYICLEEFLQSNGGLFDIPILKNTEIGLYIAKMWLVNILQALQELHISKLAMRTLSTNHLYIKKATSTIKFGHFRGVGRIDHLGRIHLCPDIPIHSLHSSLEEAFDDPYIPPEIMFAPENCTEVVDIWSLGAILHAILIGKPPKSYYAVYKEWAKLHNNIQLEPFTLPIVNPSDTTFLFSPIQQNIKDIRNLKDYLITIKDQCKTIVNTLSSCSFSSVVKGASLSQPFGKEGVRSILGELLDFIACCLSIDPTKRPLLTHLLESKLTYLDTYKQASADKFIKSMILYKSPSLCITLKAKTPLRELCLAALESPDKLLTELERPILEIVDRVINHVHTVISPYTEKIRAVMIDNEQGDSPHSPLAKQIIEERVVDMLIFLCHRYTRVWTIKNRKDLVKQAKEAEEFARKNTRLNELTIDTKSIVKESKTIPSTARNTAKVKFIDYTTIKKERIKKAEEQRKHTARERKNQELINAKRKYENTIIRNKRGLALRIKESNRVLSAMCHLIHKLVLELQYRNSIMAPFAKNVLEYLIKLMIGEDFVLTSDLIALCNPPRFVPKTPFHNSPNNPKDLLDKEWMKRHDNISVINYENYWDFNVYANVFPIFEDSIGSSGLGGGRYFVIHEFIHQSNADMELTATFTKEIDLKTNRTSEYYSEVHRLCEAITILTEDSYGIERKREEMARICSVFYGGNLECARAALDLKVMKYIHMCLQSNDFELKNYCLLIILQLSKALAGVEDNEVQDTVQDKFLLDYIHGKSVISNPTDMKRFIKLAKMLPTIYFEQNRKIFIALGASLQSPVYTSTLLKLLKDPLELPENKYILITS